MSEKYEMKTAEQKAKAKYPDSEYPVTGEAFRDAFEVGHASALSGAVEGRRFDYHSLLWKDSYSDKIQQRLPNDQESKDTEWTEYVEVAEANAALAPLRARVRVFEEIGKTQTHNLNWLNDEYKKLESENKELKAENIKMRQSCCDYQGEQLQASQKENTTLRAQLELCKKQRNLSIRAEVEHYEDDEAGRVGAFISKLDLELQKKGQGDE